MTTTMRTLGLAAGIAALAAVAAARPGDAASGDAAHAERMAKEHAGDRPVASPAATRPAAGVATREVKYSGSGETAVTGYLAVPEQGAKGAPGLIVIHEWWGLNDNVRSMARQLAAHGYQALAVDLYGGASASDPAEARKLMERANGREEALQANLRDAHRYLTGELGASRVGVIGWCFGGAWSLRTALLLGDGIDAAVVYYGHVTSDRDRLAKLEAPVLGLFGAEDQGIPVASVREFEAALKALGKPAEIHVYEGADHAFANPSGTRYQEQAAEQAWSETLEFLAAHLKR